MDSDKIFDEAQEKLTNPQAIVKRGLPTVIHTLDDLYQAAQEKRSVHWPPDNPTKWMAASFIISQPGRSLYRILKIGLKLYEPKESSWKNVIPPWKIARDKREQGKTLVEVFREEEERNANKTNP